MTLAIGGCTVAELQSRMGQTEFLDWLEYYQVEPFGEVRAEMRMGMLASVLANIHRDSKKKPEAYSPKEFMATYEIGDAPSAPLDAKTLLEKVRAINTALGGVDLTKEKD
ncbi:MAG: DUF4035 domain-containing protein [Caldilineaceae bacterium]